MPELRILPFELLVEPPFPMREQFGDMPFDELVESIRAHGVKQPLLVRPVDGHYEIMAGHRRYKASGVCALRELPCLVEEADDLQAVRTMVAENSGREDVSAAEQGRFYLSLLDRFKLDMPGLAALVRKSEAHCDERIAFVTLDPEIADAEFNHLVSYTAAKELLRVNPYTAAIVLRVPVDFLTADQVQKIHSHRKMLLDLCVRCGATQRVSHSYVEQWKRSLTPENPYPAQDNGVTQMAQTLVRQTRCLACGRDADPQNMVELKLHYYEKDKVFQILRDAGLTLYE